MPDSDRVGDAHEHTSAVKEVAGICVCVLFEGSQNCGVNKKAAGRRRRLAEDNRRGRMDGLWRNNQVEKKRRRDATGTMEAFRSRADVGESG